MSSILQSASSGRWHIKCLDSGLYLSDKTVHTVTVTAKPEHAIDLAFGGANRLLRQLNTVYPSFNWTAVRALGDEKSCAACVAAGSLCDACQE